MKPSHWDHVVDGVTSWLPQASDANEAFFGTDRTAVPADFSHRKPLPPGPMPEVGQTIELTAANELWEVVAVEGETMTMRRLP